MIGTNLIITEIQLRLLDIATIILKKFFTNQSINSSSHNLL